jgi:hypothetical protein
MVLPPSELGALQLTVAAPVEEVAMSDVGALGAPAGVTTRDGRLAGPGPAALIASTVKV